jgi:hypothetical protein
MNILKKIKTILLIFIIIFAMICFFSVKFRTLGRSFLEIPKYYGGDLFEMSRLWRFKDKIDLSGEEYENIDIQEADIITMGDSFMQSDFDTPTIYFQIQELTGKKVFNANRMDFQICGDSPLVYLDKINYEKGQAKYLILEVAERYALDSCTRYQYNNYEDYETSLNQGDVIESDAIEISEKKEVTANIKNFLDQSNLQYFFYNNKLINPFYELGKNFRFEVFGEIDKRTPIYLKEPAMLFYNDDIVFNNNVTEQQYIEMMANNIYLLGKILKEKYDLQLIYVIMPNKYSVYGEYDESFQGYNNFVPDVYNALKKLGVKTFDTYTIYKNTENIKEDILYYQADTHTTPRGKKIVVDEIYKILSKEIEGEDYN